MPFLCIGHGERMIASAFSGGGDGDGDGSSRKNLAQINNTQTKIKF